MLSWCGHLALKWETYPSSEKYNPQRMPSYLRKCTLASCVRQYVSDIRVYRTTFKTRWSQPDFWTAASDSWCCPTSLPLFGSLPHQRSLGKFRWAVSPAQFRRTSISKETNWGAFKVDQTAPGSVEHKSTLWSMTLTFWTSAVGILFWTETRPGIWRFNGVMSTIKPGSRRLHFFPPFVFSILPQEKKIKTDKKKVEWHSFPRGERAASSAQR